MSLLFELAKKVCCSCCLELPRPDLYRLFHHILFDETSLLNLVMMSPETAVSSLWRQLFIKTPYFHKHLMLVAVDEAHCICEW